MLNMIVSVAIAVTTLAFAVGLSSGPASPDPRADRCAPLYLVMAASY